MPLLYIVVVVFRTHCLKVVIYILQIEKNRGERGGFMPLQSMSSGRIDSGFGSDTSLPSTGGGYGSSSGFGLTTDIDSFSTKSKGMCLFDL